MKPYLALIRVNLNLALRERAVLFFNYIFPLIFFFGFGEMMGAQSGTISQIVSMVFVFGLLGSGLYGAGIRAVAEREANILRRYKVAPISPVPILVASMATGLVLFLPSVMIILSIAHFYYHMPFPARWPSLLLLIALGAVSMRSIGLIIASVANSVAESNILIQLLYMPMLILSGATIPLSVMPVWAQVVAQFLPATHLFTAMQAIMLKRESMLQNLVAAGALVTATAVGTFIATRLFRWEKEEKISRSSKLWLGAVLLPFLLLGGWQAYSKENINRTRSFDRQLRRSYARLIRDARLLIGDGQVIETGSVLIRGGRIERIFEGAPPENAKLDADTVEAAGKTLLPGLIDTYVLISDAGGIVEKNIDTAELVQRNLTAHLYCGAAAVGVEGHSFEEARRRINSGEWLGAEVLAAPAVQRGTGSRGLADEEFERMARSGVAYMPALAAEEAREQLAQGKSELLERSLVQQVAPPKLLELTHRGLESVRSDAGANLAVAIENLGRAHKHKVPLTAGTISGSMLLVHGPAIHRELQLWMRAGIPAGEALVTATSGAARVLGAGNRIGLIRPGYDASLLLVDGNPLQDISATERISMVFFKGERVDRPALFEQK